MNFGGAGDGPQFAAAPNPDKPSGVSEPTLISPRLSGQDGTSGPNLADRDQEIFNEGTY